MDDDAFAHLLKLSNIYLPAMEGGYLLDGIDELREAERKTIVTCLKVVAAAFVEMQRRLEVMR